MVYLKQSSCSAAIAFSPNAPLVATGTFVGATDINFNDVSSLEVRSTDLSKHGKQLHVSGGPVSTPAQFQKIVWSKPLKNASQGLIAGSLSDGTVVIWDAAKVSAAKSQASVPIFTKLGNQPSRLPAKGLAFNTKESCHRLATGGSSGDVTIYDVTTSAATSVGVQGGANGSMAAAITAVAWNPNVDHILAYASSGSVIVWDLKIKKQRAYLRDSNREPARISAIAWHPSIAIHMVVAYEDDKHPVLQLWDIRKPVPLTEFVGHTQGILGLSWCPQESSWLLSTGKDCKTILWDKMGAKLAEYTNPTYNLDVVWSPTSPGVFATSSSGGNEGQEGAVTLHSVWSAFKPQEDEYGQPVPLTTIPKWLKRPSGCAFGFGGKLFTFKNQEKDVSTQPNGPPRMVFDGALLSSQQVVNPEEAVSLSAELEATIETPWENLQPALQQFCEARIAQTQGKDETWQFLRCQTEEDNSRRTDSILEFLGFQGMIPERQAPQDPADMDEATEKLKGLQVTESNHVASTEVSPPTQVSAPPPEPEGDYMDFFAEDQTPSAAPSPRVSPRTAPSTLPKPPAIAKVESKAPRVQSGLQEDKLQQALLVANYAKAIEICLETNRMADALLIGNLGGGTHFHKAQTEYMKRQPFQYMQIANALLQRDLLGLIKTQPVQSWKQTLAAILTHAMDQEEQQGLCEALARHLDHNQYSDAAILCWICAGNVDRTIQAWDAQSLKFKGSESARIEALVERSVLLYCVFSLQTTSPQSPALSKLLSQFAGLLASQGQMASALKVLSVVETEATGPAADMKERIYNSGLNNAQEPTTSTSNAYEDNTHSHVPESMPAKATNTTQMPQNGGGNASSYFNDNVYTETGRYAQSRQNPPSPVSAPPPTALNTAGTFASINQSQPAYNAAFGAGRQFQQPTASSSYAPTPPTTAHAPPTSAYAQPPSIHKNPSVSPRSFQQPNNAFDGANNPHNAYSSRHAYQPPAQQPSFQNPPSRQSSNLETSGWQQPGTAQPVDRNTQPPQNNSNPPYNALGSSYSGASATAPTAYNPANNNQSYSTTNAPAAVAQQAPFVPQRTSAIQPAPTQPVGGGSFVTSNGAQSHGMNAPPAYQMAQPPASGPATSNEPPAPPPKPSMPSNITIATADTSKVPGDSKIIVQVLTAIHAHCTAAATASLVRNQMDDAGKKIGVLFWKLNAGELSTDVLSHLKQICQSLQAKDFQAASNGQITLAGTYWDETSPFVVALKRLIKTAEKLG